MVACLPAALSPGALDARKRRLTAKAPKAWKNRIKKRTAFSGQSKSNSPLSFHDFPSLKIEGIGSNSPLSFHDFPSLKIEGIGEVEATIFSIPASTPSRFDSTSFAVHRKNLMP